MTTLAPNADRIVTFHVPDFPTIASIITMIADRLGCSVRDSAMPRVFCKPDLITVPGVRANGCDWLFQALSRLESVAALPPGWDGEGGPPPSPQIVASAESLLHYLQQDDVPLPFICPIAGGALQMEWSFARREVELEFLDQQTIAFLRVDNTTTETSMESGEYRVSDINRSRELLDWLLGA